MPNSSPHFAGLYSLPPQQPDRQHSIEASWIIVVGLLALVCVFAFGCVPTPLHLEGEKPPCHRPGVAHTVCTSFCLCTVRA